LPGVGPKTAAAVLSFSGLRMPALPVDCHHHRVAMRLALIGPKVDVAAAHDTLARQLPREFTAQDLYDNHEMMMLHGQRCCYHRDPACGRCPVLDLCPFGQARRGARGLGSEVLRNSSGSHPGGDARLGAAAPEHRVDPEPPRAGEQQRHGRQEV